MSVAEDIAKRFEKLQNDRGTLDAHCEEIASRVIPRLSGSFSQSEKDRIEGEKRSNKMLDSTASIGLDRFSAVMESMLTPRTSRWHRVMSDNTDLNKVRRVRLWFEEVTDILFKFRYSPKANFASQKYEDYVSLGAFGTGSLFIDALASEPGLRYKAIHLGNIYFLENHQGIIDTAFRIFPYTARQAVQKWGIDVVPEKVQKAYNGNNPDEEFEFIHCVKPREEMDPTRLDFKGMKFASYYVSKESKQLMSEGGYRSFPYSISRYVTAPGEVYGRSPAMIALPSIKTLNEEKRAVLKQGHRAVDPVLLVHDDGLVDSFNLRPGAMNAGGVSADGKALVQALPVGNLSTGYQMMDQERAIINDAFLVTLFQILTENPQMTATEVLERSREKGMLLSPTMGRQQSEALGPQIERELDLLAIQGLLPEMPGELIEAEGEYTIEYDSPLSRAQKAEEAAGLFRTLEYANAYAAQTGDMSVYDHFDIDKITPAIMTINAVPEKWRRSMDDMTAIRQKRDQQESIQQAIEAAPALAGMAKSSG